MRIFYNNLIDAGNVLITYASQNDAFPATNVVNELKEKVYKTGSTLTTEFIVFDLESVQSATSVIVFNHNLDGTDTNYKLQGNSSNSWTSPPFEQVLTHGNGITKATFSSQSWRYWRIVWTKAAAFAVKSIGRVFIGTFYAPTHAPAFDGYESGDEDLSVKQRTAGGQIYTDVRQSFAKYRLDFDSIPNAQKDSFKSLAAHVGIHTSFFVQVDETAPGELSEVIYVKFQRLPTYPVAGMDADLVWNTKLELEQAL